MQLQILTQFATSPIQSGINTAYTSGMITSLFGINGAASNVISLLLFAVGILSVIMIIVGGLKYVISGGNSTAVTSAKHTVLYAIIGLMVAILAYAIINFVMSSLNGSGYAPTNI